VTAGLDTCRLTIQGPVKRADLVVPPATTIGELLPELLPHLVAEAERSQHWTLQRLGREPLDPDGTPDTLDLREGETLYLRPASLAMPAMQFDDIAVGVADAVSGRGDQSSPASTRKLLLCLACLPLAAFIVSCLTVRPTRLGALYAGVGAVILLVTSVLATRNPANRAAGVIAGFAACACAAIAGLTVTATRSGIPAPGRQGVLLAGICAAVAAAVAVGAGSVPVAAFGAVLIAGTGAAVAAVLALALHWDPAQAAGTLAVVLYVVSTAGPQLALSGARLRVPYLPRNTEELQQDIDPQSAAEISQRTSAAVAYLDSLAIGSAAIFMAASFLLTRYPSWPGLVLTGLLSTAVLLRARDSKSIWQRFPLGIAGTVGLAFLLRAGAVDASRLPAALLLVALLAVGLLLLFAAWRLPGRRVRPIWGHLGDQLRALSAVALVPLLLQLLHVYGYFRSLAG
jgi:type VII secretion integral membrane protein EccD